MPVNRQKREKNRLQDSAICSYDRHAEGKRRQLPQNLPNPEGKSRKHRLSYRCLNLTGRDRGGNVMKIHFANRHLIITAIISIALALGALIVPAKADSCDIRESGCDFIGTNAIWTENR